MRQIYKLSLWDYRNGEHTVELPADMRIVEFRAHTSDAEDAQIWIDADSYDEHVAWWLKVFNSEYVEEIPETAVYCNSFMGKNYLWLLYAWRA